MIKSIDKNHFTDELVQYMPNASGRDYILMDADEIILLKSHGKVLINKYLNHPKKDDFEFHDIKYSRPYFFEYDSERYNELFDYDKTYLKFEIDGLFDGYRFGKYYFLKGNEEAFCVDETLLKYGETNETVRELNKDEVEDFFDNNKYDSMYIINREGFIKFAYTKKDGTIIDMNIIPTDEEIIKRELQKRKSNEFLARTFNVSPEYEPKEITPKSIDEIREFPIYDKGMFHGYYHILVTSKDGKFDVNWLGLDFVEKEKYRLTLENIPIVEPTIYDVIAYKRTDSITPAPTPSYDDELCFRLQSIGKLVKTKKVEKEEQIQKEIQPVKRLKR